MDPIDAPLIVKKPSSFQKFMSGPMDRNKAIILGTILVIALLITGAFFWLGFESQNENSKPEATPTPIESPTPTDTPDVSPTDETVPTDTPTPTKKPVTPTPTKTPTPSPTNTPTPTVTSTPTPTGTTFSVTGTTSNYVGSTGTCAPDKTHAFSGDITTNMGGTVQYRWTRNEGPVGATKTLVFSGPGTLPVEQDQWTLSSPSYSGWNRIDILSPNSTSSNQANFTHTCP